MMIPAHSSLKVFLFTISISISACNWVDSTGRQTNTTPTIQLNDGTPEDGFTKVIIEDQTDFIDPGASSDTDGSIVSWSWNQSPTASGSLNVCLDVDGFNQQYAADTLQDACTDSNDCHFEVVTEEIDKTQEEIDAEIAQLEADVNAINTTVSDTKTIFNISVPKLKAPIGLTYDISAIDNDGGVGTAKVNFCLIAINDPPEAYDDVITIVEGEEKVVGVDDQHNLLNNDLDDIDNSNQPLFVITDPMPTSSAPGSTLTVRSDGGFDYFYPKTPANTATDGITDSFEYTISDGTTGTDRTSTATVTFRIVTVDDAPELVKNIPTLTWIAGIANAVDFSASFKDPEGANLVYSETTGNLPNSFSQTKLLKGILSAKPTIHEVDTYSIALAAYDGNTSSNPEPVTLTIKQNKPPTISAIPNQVGEIGKAFSLNLGKYANDPERQTLTYTISGQPSYLRISSSSINGTPNSAAQSIQIKVSVSDGFNPAVSQKFSFSVKNPSPEIKSPIPDQSYTAGEVVVLNIKGHFKDPNNDNLSFRATGLPSSLSISSAGVISGTVTSVGNFTVKVFASDNNTEISDTFIISVGQQNSAPIINQGAANQTVVQGTAVTFNTVFSDPDSDNLTFSLDTAGSGLTKSNTGNIAKASGIANNVGTFNLTMTATDPDGASIEDHYTLTVTAAPIPNRAPTITQAAQDQTVVQGSSVTFSTVFSDPDNDNLTFTLSHGGSGLSKSNTGNTAIASGVANNVGTFNLIMKATDPDGAIKTDNYKLIVTAAPVPNRAPTISQGAADQTVVQGTNVTFDTVFSDLDNDNLTFTLNAAGSGLTKSKTGNTAKASGIANNVGTFNITMTAADPDGATITDSYTLEVTAAPIPNRTPTISQGAADQTVVQGENVTFNTVFSDLDSDSLAFSLNADGSGLSKSDTGNTAKASGIANNVGIFNITMTATDPDGATITDNYKLTVNAPVVVNTPPTRQVKGISQYNIPLNTLVTFTTIFKDPDSADASLKITLFDDGASFLSIATSGKEATVSGTTNKTGTFKIAVTAEDNAGATVTDNYTLQVTSQAPVGSTI